MASLLERKLIVVTGKGGTGKTTVACALGLLGAQQGLRTIVAELGAQHRLPALFGHSHPPDVGVEVELETRLWSTSIDPDKALLEWLRTLGGRLSVRMLSASSTFHYFAAAAPGAKELVSMVKVRELCEGAARDDATRADTPQSATRHDLVILDAPASGHALAMLRSPQTFAAIVRVGPLADQAHGVRELLEDPHRTAYVAVTHASEMAVSETIELEEGLRRHLDRDLDAVIVNGTVPRRFTREELALIATVSRHTTEKKAELEDSSQVPAGENIALARSAAHVAHAIHERARVQQSQIARLRRQRFAAGSPPCVLSVPFAFEPELDLTAVRQIAAQLKQRKL